LKKTGAPISGTGFTNYDSHSAGAIAAYFHAGKGEKRGQINAAAANSLNRARFRKILSFLIGYPHRADGPHHLEISFDAGNEIHQVHTGKAVHTKK
jgi:hypothetical protein